MINVHGIVYAYHDHPDLGELCKERTAAALPFCGRFRLVDFALSSMMNAGIFDVGVVMQYGFQSLMEHLNSGRPWNMVRHSGGMHLLLAPVNRAGYDGDMQALEGISNHLSRDVKQDYVLLTRGDLCANIDFSALIEQHMRSGADVTAVCTTEALPCEHHRFIPDESGAFAAEMLSRQRGEGRGLASLETYILRRGLLLEMMRWSRESDRLHFHSDGLQHVLHAGWRIGLYRHTGYARIITSVAEYYEANMDMLDRDKRLSLFPPNERYVATRARSDVSTYYGETARVTDSLIADGCRIEGQLDRCILSSGVRVADGAHLRGCILLNDTVIGPGTDLRCVIADKNVNASPHIDLAGNARLPIVIPKGTVL